MLCNVCFTPPRGCLLPSSSQPYVLKPLDKPETRPWLAHNEKTDHPEQLRKRKEIIVGGRICEKLLHRLNHSSFRKTNTKSEVGMCGTWSTFSVEFNTHQLRTNPTGEKTSNCQCPPDTLWICCCGLVGILADSTLQNIHFPINFSFHSTSLVSNVHAGNVCSRALQKPSYSHV